MGELLKNIEKTYGNIKIKKIDDLANELVDLLYSDDEILTKEEMYNEYYDQLINKDYTALYFHLIWKHQETNKKIYLDYLEKIENLS